MTTVTKHTPLETLKEKVKDAKNQLAYRFIALVATPRAEKHLGYIFLAASHVIYRFSCDNFSAFLISNPDIHAKQALNKCRAIQAAMADFFAEDGEDLYAKSVLEDLSEDASKALQDLREPRAYTTEGIFVDGLMRSVYVMNFAGHYTEGSLDDADGKVYDGGEIEALADIHLPDSNEDETPPVVAAETQKTADDSAEEKPEPAEGQEPSAVSAAAGPDGHLYLPELKLNDTGDTGPLRAEDAADCPCKGEQNGCRMEDPECCDREPELAFDANAIAELLLKKLDADDESKPYGTIFLAGCYDKKFRAQLVEILTRNLFIKDPDVKNAQDARREIIDALAKTDSRAARLLLVSCGPIG